MFENRNIEHKTFFLFVLYGFEVVCHGKGRKRLKALIIVQSTVLGHKTQEVNEDGGDCIMLQFVIFVMCSQDDKIKEDAITGLTARA